MSELLKSLWQFNIEISLLLLVTLLARFVIRKSTRVYNAYLLWLSIPVGMVAAQLISHIDFSSPPVAAVNTVVHTYVLVPTRSSTPDLVTYFWLLIASVLLLRLVGQHLQLRADLRKISSGTALPIRSNYPIRAVADSKFSPSVYGFIRPTIYFPTPLLEQLSAQQIELIIQHEEHHIKQQHLWLNLAWDILVALLWFNPLVYLSRQGFRHDQELFCDYLVLYNSDRQNQRSYGHALLTTVSATHSVSLLCSWKTFNQLEERIMSIKKPSSFSSKILLSLCSMGIVGCTSLYSVSAADYATPDAPASEPDSERVMLVTQRNKSSHRVTLDVDDKKYIEEDGAFFVIDESGKHTMSAKEKRYFERELAKAKAHSHPQNKTSKRVVKIINDVNHPKLTAEEVEKLKHQMVRVEELVEAYPAEIPVTNEEIDIVIDDIESLREREVLSALEMREVEAHLEAELAHRDQTIHAELEHAKAEIERLRSELKRVNAKKNTANKPQ